MNGHNTEIKGLIFDCDGVLFDSHPANLAYYNTVLKQLGAPLVTPENHRHAQLCHTACSRDVFRGLLEEEQIEEALGIAGSLDYRQFIAYLKPFEGMLEVLPQLAAHYPLALATNRTSSVSLLLDHFSIRECFQSVVTSSDVALPKPSPQMLHLAAKELGYPESRLLFVGDAPSDRQAADSAGCRFVAFGESLKACSQVSGWSEFKGWLPSG
mgnify:CR=1 FL=1